MTGALVGQVQASPSTDIRERQTMTAVFDQNRRTFGSERGMAIMDQLEKMQIDLAELRSQREEDRRTLDHHRVLLDQLAPVRLQIAPVRRPVLAKLAHSITENWASNPLATQSRNVFAHGGQLKTDIATIHSEPDPAERQLLRKGFELGYGPLPCPSRGNF